MRALFAFLCFFLMSIPVFAESFDEQSAPISLSVGGYARWYGVYSDVFHQKGTKKINRDSYNFVDVMGDMEIYFQGETDISDTLKIGFTAQLNSATDDIDTDIDNEYAFYADKKNGRIWDEVFLMIDGDFGRFFIGNVRNVAYQIAVTAPTVSALGVQESDFTGLYGTLPVTTLPVYDYLSAKVSYLSPVMNGLSVGFSFLPSNNINGHDDTVLKNGTLNNAEIATVLYQTEIEPYFISASMSYARYEPQSGKAGENFSTGINIGAGNWTIGSSFMRSLYRDLNNKDPVGTGIINGGSVNTFDIGFSYDIGLMAASVNYIDMNGKNKDGVLRQKMWQTSFRYKLGAGIDVFTDASYVRLHVAESKRSHVGMATGFDLSF